MAAADIIVVITRPRLKVAPKAELRLKAARQAVVQLRLPHLHLRKVARQAVALQLRNA